MKNILFLTTFFLFAACSCELSQPSIEFSSNAEFYEVVDYMDEMETDASMMINAANAFQVTSFEDTPKSVVAYFYASIIRKDQEWQKVCLPYNEQTPEFKKTIEQYNTWRTLTYVPQPSYNNDIMFRLEFTDMNGEKGHGDRVITVEEIDGKYLLTEIPAF